MAVVQVGDASKSAVVRIRDASGAVVGAGFMVDEDIVCSCAHAIAWALDLREVPTAAPAGSVHLDFPLLRREGAGAVNSTAPGTAGVMPSCRTGASSWRERAGIWH
ncbi:hypothetical protein OHA79_41785 [Streptomyces sp. NBC_00841]|uniref:hypothetical protein n=1 Tax=unclassified Streptomyces TaxID=2593676 RepID=UPI002255D258|nr:MULTISPECIES: hypothetical protein [unclassified Streptomyces]MCX4530468.1 hypothetical protein [Streptomyces sp. NBC_01669]WSA03768.1 hypothetical protein OHA79_41785 [Streptomyces sp. NBC_00841]